MAKDISISQAIPKGNKKSKCFLCVIYRKFLIKAFL